MARYQTDQASKNKKQSATSFSVGSFYLEWALAFPIVAKSCQIYENNWEIP